MIGERKLHGSPESAALKATKVDDALYEYYSIVS